MEVYLVCETVDLGAHVASVHASLEGAEAAKQLLVRETMEFWEKQGCGATGEELASKFYIQPFEVIEVVEVKP